MIQENFVEYIEGSIRENWNRPAFSDYRAETLGYSQVAERILRLHALFETAGLRKGDRVALLGRNSSSWATCYLAALTYGAVIVPILPDFRPSDIERILEHSGASLFFTTEAFLGKLDRSRLGGLKGILSLEDYGLLSGAPGGTELLSGAAARFEREYRERMEPKAFRLAPVPNDALAAIVYTSGTTGFSKGVMLTHNVFISNLVYSQKNVFLFPGDTILSFLPLAHMFGCAFEFIFPFSRGCHITFLGRIPSTGLLIEAFAAIKPRLVLTVPLVIEKIYYKQISPLLQTPKMQVLLRLPLVRSLIYRKIRDKIMGFFGGNVIQVIIGGASFNAEVERFLKLVRFPYTIGYGMTECGPLITYVGWKEHRQASVGHIVDGMEMRIVPLPDSAQGEIYIRGENLMSGYYRNPEETAAAIGADGWFRTGDLGSMDKDGVIFIRGRSKTMILNSSGQNIYPEEIEARLNVLPMVAESLVRDEGGKLAALVYPDRAEAEKQGLTQDSLAALMEEHRRKVNKELPDYSRLFRIDLKPDEFEKTPTNKIKRFLYTETT